MEMPLISIVVPVYNVAPYMQRCIDSLLNQDYPNIEIILVDDGSTDESPAICRKNKSEKIKVFTKPNGGLSSARNFGLERCSPSSEYVAFVDSDDTVSHDYISLLSDHPASLTVCSIKHFYPTYSSVQSVPESTYENLKTNQQFAAIFESGIMNPAWNKLFKLSIIRHNNLRFKNIKVLEDIDFVFQYLKHCSNVRTISAPLYNYHHREGTESKTCATHIYDNYMVLHREMLEWFDPSLEPEINRFVYPQYLAVTLRFIHAGDFTSPKPYLKQPLVKKSFAAHRCTSVGETLLHNMVRFGMLRIARQLFLR